MKKLFLRLGLIASLSLALFSCDKADTHQNLIPKNSDVVLMINPAQIAEKAELSSEKNTKLIQEYVKSLDNPELTTQLEELIKNPEKSGLDVKAPIYGFMNFSEDAEPQFAALVLKLKNEKDFKELFLNLNTKDKEIEEGDLAGFKTIKVKGFDVLTLATKEDKALLFVAKEDLQAKLKAVLEQKEGDSFATTKMFAELTKTKEDFEAVVNYGKLASSVYEKNPMYSEPLYSHLMQEVKENFPLDNFYYLLSLNSEKGALTFKTDVYSEDEKYQEFIEDWYETMPDTEGTFIGKMPKNSLVAFNFAVDGTKLWETAEKYFPKTLAEIQENSKESLAKYDVTLADIFKTFKGDMTGFLAGSLAEFQQQQADARAFIQLANTETAIKLMNKFMEEVGEATNISKTAENQYLVNAEVPVRFGLKDKVLFVSTKQVDNVDALFEDADPSVKESTFAGKIENKRVSFIFNIAEIVNLTKPFMGFMINAKAIAQLEQIDYISMTNTNKLTQSETILKLKNDKNPYAVIMDFAREASGN